jgi:hypothetical protein
MLSATEPENRNASWVIIASAVRSWRRPRRAGRRRPA